ncbi:MAG: class I SAM-dependent methyltransferase [Treponema sp.]|jgi:SAM-dependent methyltransferase|nr:class I SAM-dependent methyltransferase [Treponema sp.]
MEREQEWFNDGNFWGIFAPIMFDEARWAELPLVADSVTRLARLDLYGPGPAMGGPSGPRLLDLCCGFGRLTLEFAARGFACTGVDITAAYLESGREDAAAGDLDIEFVHADIRDFIRPRSFDLAVNLYISFGYFADPRDDRQVLANVYESLTSGGVLIIETLGKELAVRDFVRSEWFRRAGYLVLTEYSPVDSWAGLRNHWTLVGEGEREGERIEKVFTQRLYAATELRALLVDSGFARVEIYGGWDESPYDERAEKLILVARKR